jgi:hypothetical protein
VPPIAIAIIAAIAITVAAAAAARRHARVSGEGSGSGLAWLGFFPSIHPRPSLPFVFFIYFWGWFYPLLNNAAYPLEECSVQLFTIQWTCPIHFSMFITDKSRPPREAMGHR